jgi:hypothetical protein
MVRNVGSLLAAFLAFAAAPPAQAQQEQERELTFCEKRAVEVLAEAKALIDRAQYAEFGKSDLVGQACRRLNVGLSVMKDSYSCKDWEMEPVGRSLQVARDLLSKANAASNTAFKCDYQY